ncbi:RagB/SusD family nutrient uptake outer membrane protein [Saccharicrinis aurantiacus]|uniref:RagB/SusD family nutrient uptake outer membrane protein n=1 Tax=Saccharicrinis aurantiacus TaxID=1849719 RepID=UPI0008382684|nr:RagB/SusD family nutrient uptake outer membrane protein [Saccharicrinis aurantiacus]
MKTINKIVLGFAVVLGLSSCEGLDVEPKSFYSADNFYKSIDDARSSLYYAYDALTLTSYAPLNYYFGELPTDNCNVKPDEGADAQALVNWEVTSQNTLLLEYYRSAYIGINRANAVIANVVDRGFEQSEVDDIVGQAYFLRAWNHFNIVRTFGLAPLQKNFINTLEQTTTGLPQDMQEVYTFLIDDLTKSIELLNVNRVVGLADKVAAQALLAKVYLYAASAKSSGVPKYDVLQASADELYAKAAEYSALVLTGQNVYGHDTVPRNIYSINSPDGPEHIFILSMDRTGTNEGDFSKISRYFIPSLGGAKFFVKHSDNTFEKTLDGWSVFQTTSNLLNSYGSDDRRRVDLMTTEAYDEKDTTLVGNVSDGTVAYEFTLKYLDADFEGEKTSVKPYLIRYSDVQLIYAEAVASGGEALKQYNQIRKRAGVDELDAMPSKEEFRKLVIEERRRELAFEGDRLWDLRRNNMVQEKVVEAAGLTPEALSFYPIPQREIDLNPNIN